ncbi:hypothetical protein ACFLZP_00090 [Patescibacteria group bacterium]
MDKRRFRQGGTGFGEKSQELVLKTLVYSDLFDYPLTGEEIKKNLISSRQISKKILKKAINSLVEKKLIGKKDNLYYLQGRKKVVALRKEKKPFSKKKMILLHKVAASFKKIPWVRAVVATGGLSRENARAEDDIDLLIITSNKRLWLTRCLIIALLELKGKRRRPGGKVVKDKFCLNVFLDQGHLVLPKNKRSLFTAYEVLQTKLVWQRENAYQQFICSNQWTKGYLFNAFQAKFIKELPSEDEEPFFERRIGDSLEKLFYLLQKNYMKSRQTNEKVSRGQAFFHPQDSEKWVLERYRRRWVSLLDTHLGSG